MTDGLKDAHRQAIIAEIAANERLERAVLFGSRATGTNTVSSDVDIALFGDRLTLTDQARLAAALDEIPMAQSVDLLLHRSIQDRKLREHIRRQGIEWYKRPAPDEAHDSSLVHACSSDWVLINLGAVCTKIGSGATPRGGKDVYLPSGPYALIRSQNVLNDGLGHDGLAYIGERHASELAGVEVLDRDVLLNITGDSVARACQVDPHILPARVNQHVAIIRPDPKKLDPGFLRYYLVCPTTQAKLLSWAGSGGTRNALTKEMIEAFDVQAPEDVSEQRAIAHVLGTLNDQIELNRRMNETLEAMARALFESWFVDFDPVRAKMEGRDTGLPQEIVDLFPDRLVDSEIGEMPEGWEVFRLDQLSNHHAKSTSPACSPRLEYEHFSIPAYDAGQRPAIELGSGIRSNKTLVLNDAVLLSKLNPRIPRVWVPPAFTGRPQVCSTEFLVFRPRPPANRGLLFTLFTNRRFRTLLQSLVTGTSTSHQRVPPKALKAYEVLAGSPKVFAVFGDVIGGMLARILRNRSETATLAALRDTLLPKLITGELRVQAAEKFIGRVG